MLVGELLEHTVGILRVAALLVDVHLEEGELVALAVELLQSLNGREHVLIVLLGVVEAYE